MKVQVAPTHLRDSSDLGDGLPMGLVDIDRPRGRFRVNRSAYKSPAVFQAEQRLIFDKCWLYLGHKTELKAPGDYVSRQVAGRNLIFLRDRKGEFHAFYNSCTHRGARVCRENKGTAKNFTCPYHGWTFDLTGKLVSTFSSEGYREDLNEGGRLNLPSVPRLENYRGFYFVNFNPRAISLSDYLADAKGVIDCYCDQAAEGEDGLYIMEGDHAYSIRANYKYLVENSYDGYHVIPTHESWLDYLRDRVAGTQDAQIVADIGKDFRGKGGVRGLGNGHALLSSWVPNGRPVAYALERWPEPVKKEIAANRQRLISRYGEERATYLADMQKNCVIFPNLVFNDNVGLTIRYIEPVSPDENYVRAWGLGHTGESEAVKQIRLDNYSNFLGPAGFGSADDIEMLELCQSGIEHCPTEWTELSKGMDASAPDLRRQTGAPDDECQMQAYWTQWDNVIRGVDTFERT